MRLILWANLFRRFGIVSINCSPNTCDEFGARNSLCNLAKLTHVSAEVNRIDMGFTLCFDGASFFLKTKSVSARRKPDCRIDSCSYDSRSYVERQRKYGTKGLMLSPRTTSSLCLMFQSCQLLRIALPLMGSYKKQVKNYTLARVGLLVALFLRRNTSHVCAAEASMDHTVERELVA